MKRVAVVILNWNGEKLLREFLPSVIRNTNREIGRVVVADNYSTDASLAVMRDEFPDVDVIRLDKNYGFAGGYNRVVEQVAEEYVVLLNSDVEVAEGWLEPLVGLLDKEPEVAALQPKIKAYKEKNKFEYAGACGGFIDRFGFPFCRGRIMDMTEADEGQYDNITEVFWCSGAALCVRQEVYLSTGGLDEDFFAHMEEIDLCWRMANRGYKLKVNPASVVYHLGGGSLPMNHPRKLFLNYRNNLLMLYKNLGRKERGKVLFCRLFFDAAAVMFFLLKGEWANVRAVFSAYREYAKMKKRYNKECCPERAVTRYNKSIVLAYYLHRVRKFSELGIK